MNISIQLNAFSEMGHQRKTEVTIAKLVVQCEYALRNVKNDTKVKWYLNFKHA